MTDEKRRGFAAMTPEQRREFGSRGGKKSQAMGKGHKFTPEEAVEAGSRGGLEAHRRKRAHKFNSESGRKAGLISAERAKEKALERENLNVEWLAS